VEIPLQYKGRGLNTAVTNVNSLHVFSFFFYLTAIRSNAMLVACKYAIRHILSEISVFVKIENFDSLHLWGYVNNNKFTKLCTVVLQLNFRTQFDMSNTLRRQKNIFYVVSLGLPVSVAARSKA